MLVHCVLLSKAKLLSLHWTYLLLGQGMESPCTGPPDSWDCDLGCSSPVLPCELSSLLWLGKGSHLPGIYVYSFSHEQSEE